MRLRMLIELKKLLWNLLKGCEEDNLNLRLVMVTLVGSSKA